MFDTSAGTIKETPSYNSRRRKFNSRDHPKNVVIYGILIPLPLVHQNATTKQISILRLTSSSPEIPILRPSSTLFSFPFPPCPWRATMPTPSSFSTKMMMPTMTLRSPRTWRRIAATAASAMATTLRTASDLGTPLSLLSSGLRVTGRSTSPSFSVSFYVYWFFYLLVALCTTSVDFLFVFVVYFIISAVELEHTLMVLAIWNLDRILVVWVVVHLLFISVVYGRVSSIEDCLYFHWFVSLKFSLIDSQQGIGSMYSVFWFYE